MEIPKIIAEKGQKLSEIAEKKIPFLKNIRAMIQKLLSVTEKPTTAETKPDKTESNAEKASETFTAQVQMQPTIQGGLRIRRIVPPVALEQTQVVPADLQGAPEKTIEKVMFARAEKARLSQADQERIDLYKSQSIPPLNELSNDSKQDFNKLLGLHKSIAAKIEEIMNSPEISDSIEFEDTYSQKKHPTAPERNKLSIALTDTIKNPEINSHDERGIIKDFYNIEKKLRIINEISNQEPESEEIQRKITANRESMKSRWIQANGEIKDSSLNTILTDTMELLVNIHFAKNSLNKIRNHSGDGRSEIKMLLANLISETTSECLQQIEIFKKLNQVITSRRKKEVYPILIARIIATLDRLYTLTNKQNNMLAQEDVEVPE